MPKILINKIQRERDGIIGDQSVSLLKLMGQHHERTKLIMKKTDDPRGKEEVGADNLRSCVGMGLPTGCAPFLFSGSRR